MHRIDPRSDSYSALMFDVITNAHRYIPTPGDSVLDLGAHFGMFSLFCAARGCHVKAYEPAPEAFAELQHTAEVAKEIGLGTIDPHMEAIWSTRGPALLFQRAESSAVRNLLCGTNPEDVACVTLRDAMEDKMWSCVKVDIEGAEHAVFRAAEQEDFDRMKFLTIEIHNDLLPEGGRHEVVGKLTSAFPHHLIIPVKVKGEPTKDVATLVCWR